MPQPPIFHVAIAVNDLAETRRFYVDDLGCTERTDTSTDEYAVINFHGAQLVAIEAPDQVEKIPDGVASEPIKHFGMIMDWDDWHAMADRLKAAKTDFLIEPNVKSHDGIGEVGNMFLRDPSGNNLEFKSYKDRSKVL